MSLCLENRNYDLFIKRAISGNVLERPHDVTRVLNSFKLLIKQIYQKGCAQQFNMKKDQNTEVASPLHKIQENLLTLKQKKQIDF